MEQLQVVMKGDNPADYCMIPLVNKEDCEHIDSVCYDCLSQWQADFTINFTRTKSGRALQHRLGLDRLLTAIEEM